MVLMCWLDERRRRTFGTGLTVDSVSGGRSASCALYAAASESDSAGEEIASEVNEGVGEASGRRFGNKGASKDGVGEAICWMSNL